MTRRAQLLRAATVALLALGLFVAITARDVEARGPDERCLACATPTPRPAPVVIGILGRRPVVTGRAPILVGAAVPPTAAPTLPPTDTEELER